MSRVDEPPPSDAEPRPAAGGERRAGLGETAKAVGAAFFGVRGGAAHDRDMRRLNPVHVILVGIALAALFVLSLIVIVRLVVAR